MHFGLFADDLTIAARGDSGRTYNANDRELEGVLQKAYRTVLTWAAEYHMDVSSSKTVYMRCRAYSRCREPLRITATDKRVKSSGPRGASCKSVGSGAGFPVALWRTCPAATSEESHSYGCHPTYDVFKVWP